MGSPCACGGMSESIRRVKSARLALERHEADVRGHSTSTLSMAHRPSPSLSVVVFVSVVGGEQRGLAVSLWLVAGWDCDMEKGV